ncbi:hypothetical protein CLOM_g4672 [Closterium sp. NIES-68]|nr:hypothetical protein CLOM_g4672 [Closterium sp. NIES-68]GJP57702.1 hypothetical protein CLOP_g17118 [Closterium sp. NIES-67]
MSGDVSSGIPWDGVLACASGLAFHWLSSRSGNDQPITCENSSLRGVIVEQTAEQFFLKHNDAGAWVQDSAFLIRNMKSVPWYIEDGTGRANVVGARSAAGLELTVGTEVFDDSGKSVVRSTVDYLQGIKVLGVKRVEKVLPVGTSLTVVGEAVRDDRGSITLQRPHQGGPFFVSPRSLDALIASLGTFSQWCRWLYLGCTAVGAVLIVGRVVGGVMERRRRAAIRRRVLEAEAAASARDRSGSSARQGQESDDTATSDAAKSATDDDVPAQLPDTCVICLEQKYNSVFVPCGHMCCCVHCAAQLTQCPLCRRRIDQLVRTYRH